LSYALGLKKNNLIMTEENEETISKMETIESSPEWQAGVKFLDDCMVNGDDERFSRFYDFIAGWNASQNHIKSTHVPIEDYNKLKAQVDNQMKHKESIKQYWLSCAESKKKWVEAIKEYFDSEHTEDIQSFDDFKEQFDLD
jgi:hypothetical protein